jgi:predicted alpha/beta-fold hydrolase
MNEDFSPGYLFRNPHLQTFLGRSKLRIREEQTLRQASAPVILDGGNGVRLLGYHSRQPGNDCRGLIALIHGWEGSVDSTYILSTACFFFRKGFDVFRLNLRDHGESHHLNEGLFHGALLPETFGAMQHIGSLCRQGHLFIVGFSLGGNYALRIALKHGRQDDVPNLSHVFAVSPALDPYKATLAIDQGLAIYRRYFLKKWKRSLLKKERLFPNLYDFGPMMKIGTCMELTEAIMPYYPDFHDYRHYFRHYTLTDRSFENLSVPVTIMISEDDPVVPIQDFRNLKKKRHLHLSIQRYGGHCGFIDMPAFSCWYERKIYDTICAG